MNHLEILKKELAAGEAQLLDVREFHEWSAGHLKAAKFAPLSQLEGLQEPDDADPNLKTYIHCRSGRRVLSAAPLLEEMGFTNVIPLAEGFDQLAQNGFEVE